MYRWFSRSVVMPLLLAVAAVTGLLAAPAASAAVHPGQTGAARFASEATAYQNKVIDGALASVPGGTRISASEVKWPSGAVLGVPAVAATNELNTCLDSMPELAYCAFTAANYEGGWVALPQAFGWFQWGMAFPNQGTHSWYNQTQTRVWREQFQNHGNELCIDPWPSGNYTVSNYTGADVYDWWILMTTNESTC